MAMTHPHTHTHTCTTPEAPHSYPSSLSIPLASPHHFFFLFSRSLALFLPFRSLLWGALDSAAPPPRPFIPLFHQLIALVSRLFQSNGCNISPLFSSSHSTFTIHVGGSRLNRRKEDSPSLSLALVWVFSISLLFCNAPSSLPFHSLLPVLSASSSSYFTVMHQMRPSLASIPNTYRHIR